MLVGLELRVQREDDVKRLGDLAVDLGGSQALGFRGLGLRCAGFRGLGVLGIQVRSLVLGGLGVLGFRGSRFAFAGVW